MRKQRIRIYKKSDEYEYIDITKGLTAFYDRCIGLQYIWCLSFGLLIKINPYASAVKQFPNHKEFKRLYDEFELTGVDKGRIENYPNKIIN